MIICHCACGVCTAGGCCLPQEGSPYRPYLPWQPWRPAYPAPAGPAGPFKCAECGVWWTGLEHRCTPYGPSTSSAPDHWRTRVSDNTAEARD